ncbi:hypothetical protein [Actinomycetospora lemnae]|uniref:Uncharacterized protein n=1 Tax=Actinomycetospora lemnae TaxID=3019891 RepID=A0ABT5SZE9_9PSEU|nr:hypothetical protein [Actinomycetospora sp. DW7H6]MDD7967805.1 hypothetical protein [Actinomycetospora sp. DW7H6]
MISREPELSAGQPLALLPPDPWHVDGDLVTVEEKRAAMNLADRESLLQINRTLGFPTPVDWLPDGRECAEVFDGDVERFLEERKPRGTSARETRERHTADVSPLETPSAQSVSRDVGRFLEQAWTRAASITINIDGDHANVALGAYITQNQAASEPVRSPSWTLERPNPRKDTVVLTNCGAGSAYDVDIERPPTPMFRGDTHYDRVDPGQKIILALRFTGQTRLADRTLCLTYGPHPGGEKKTWKSSVPS